MLVRVLYLPTDYHCTVSERVLTSDSRRSLDPLHGSLLPQQPHRHVSRLRGQCRGFHRRRAAGDMGVVEAGAGEDADVRRAVSDRLICHVGVHASVSCCGHCVSDSSCLYL